MRSAFEFINRRTVRREPNPLDKCTIVSIYPKKIREVKYTIEPGTFVIEPGTMENPSTLIIGPSSWWKEIDDKQPLLEIPNSSVAIADSVIRDYCSGLVGYRERDAMPGLFFVPGEFDTIQIKIKYSQALKLAESKQKNWWMNLISMADILWARSNGNPLSISDDARMGAEQLQLKDKPWMQDFSTISMVQCKACGHLKNPKFPVCPNCKAIDDPEAAKALGLEFAR